ncbi:GFA family protein [Pararhodobacter marinus]|uniref:GFA family protein n=1 Tax=Pararhodobacter marinus TaxID=2184063 RepID=UPI0035116279
MSTIPCRCGDTALELTGGPIMTATCHCTSCRTAGAELAALPGAVPVADAHGGTPYVMWRKDRVTVLRGAGHLREHRLSPKGSRRVVAVCCNSPLYLNFPGGHWLSLYAARFDAPPPPELRTMLMDVDGPLPDDGVPGAKRQTARFMGKLLLSWAATGFRRFPLEPMLPLEVTR